MLRRVLAGQPGIGLECNLLVDLALRRGEEGETSQRGLGDERDQQTDGERLTEIAPKSSGSDGSALFGIGERRCNLYWLEVGMGSSTSDSIVHGRPGLKVPRREDGFWLC